MKKIVAMLLLVSLLLTIGLMAGCSGTNSVLANKFEIPEGGYDGSAVTITFYHTMGATDGKQDILNHYIGEFNKLFPNITVKHEQVGGYDDVRDQIKTQLTVGKQPNIAYCYPDHVALYNVAKAVVTLDELIDSTITVTHADGTTETLGMTAEQKADFIEGYYNEGREFGDNLMYTLPFSKSTEVLYYNKTFFEEHELQVPKTWDDLGEVCKKIKEIDPNSIPLGYDSESNWFITMCEQYGSPYTSATGDHFLFDNDTNKSFVKTFRDWYQKGYVTTQEIYQAYTSGLFTATTGTRSYMCIGSSAGASHQIPKKDANGNYPFEVGIATIPQVNPDAPKVISQGPSLCIFKDANPQEVVASWLFVKYLTTNVDFQAAFADCSGYVPVLKSVAQHPTYAAKMANANGFENLTYLSAKVCIEQADAYYTSPAFNGSSDARDQVGILIQSALTGDDNGNLDAFIDKLFKDAVDKCNR
jgi:multiple sugar transport system substrate-binding protein